MATSTTGIQHEEAERLATATTSSSAVGRGSSSGSFYRNNNRTAGFIHIGKCGGSSISTQLRNGCHSFVKKPCAVVENETILSELVTDYYHVPDALKVPKSKHDIYVFTARDPLERLISAFCYLHPLNRKARGVLADGQEGIRKRANIKSYKCFPTLERFAQLVGNKSKNRTNNTTSITATTGSLNRSTHMECQRLARQSVRGNVRIMTHMWGNYQRFVEPILQRKQPSKNGADLYVIRQQHLWKDWRNINALLDPNREVLLPSSSFSHRRHVNATTMEPVKRTLSEEGRSNLCAALTREYNIYFDLLKRAINLNETDVQEAVAKARSNCPNVKVPHV